MDAQHATVALQTLLALAGFLFVWNVLLPRHAVESARQRLFDIRHRLFMLALRQESGLTFQSPAYQSSRRSINAMINALASFNVWVLFGMVASDLCRGGLKKRDNTFAPEGQTTPEQKLALASTEKQVALAVAKYFYFRTPLASTLAIIVIAVAAVTYFFARYLKRACERRGLFNFNPVAAVRARIQQGVAAEMKFLIRRVSEFDEAAPWNHEIEDSGAGFGYPHRQTTMQVR